MKSSKELAEELGHGQTIILLYEELKYKTQGYRNKDIAELPDGSTKWCNPKKTSTSDRGYTQTIPLEENIKTL